MIYVDEIQDYPHCRLPYKRWCHLATDGALEESPMRKLPTLWTHSYFVSTVGEAPLSIIK